MSQFAGDDTMSIIDSINDGKHYVPMKPKESAPASVGKKLLIALVAVALVAVFAFVIWLSSN